MKKFTLMELLIVVAIIAILLSLLLPTLRGAREKGKFAVCVSNMMQNYRLIGMGASDNNGRLPQFFYNSGGGQPPNLGSNLDKLHQITPNYMREDWMGAMQTLHKGSHHIKHKRYGIVNPVAALYSHPGLDWIYRGTPEYDNMEQHPLTEIMRCPSLEEGEVQSGWGTNNGDGIGSNGSHDYSFTQGFRTLYLSQIGTYSIQYGNEMATPLIIEEDPYYHKNRGNRETSWANGDSVGTWHDFGKKGSYIGLDGSHNVVRYTLRSVDIWTDIRGADTEIRNASTTGVGGFHGETVPGEPGSTVTRQ